MPDWITLTATCEGRGSNAYAAMADGRKQVREFFAPNPAFSERGQSRIKWAYGEAEVRERDLGGKVILWTVPVTGTYDYFPLKAPESK